MPLKPEVIELDLQELEALLERIDVALGEEVAGPFRELLRSYVQLVAILGNKELSLQKLRELLFGARTERTSNVQGPEQGSGNEGASSAQSETRDGAAEPSAGSADEEETSGGEERGPEQGSGRRTRPGHGRNGAEEYSGCTTVVVAHPWLSPGDACPNCDGGKVYEQTEPARLVRLVGQTPVGGKVYELQRLRCHLCGAVFTAEQPEDAGQQKYDATAVSMMALLRYGYGMPGNRLANLQQSLGIPLPASTQWEMTSGTAAQLVPVFEYLIFTAAQGDVVYHDDTTARVLELMDKDTRRQALSADDPDRCGIFTTGIVSTAEGHAIALFFTGTRHAGENLREVLAQRAAELPPPIQMCDALSRNMPEDLKTILANCLAHGRRRFYELADAFPEQVLHVLEALKQVYQVDAEAKQQQFSPEARLLLHQQRSGPVMDSLHQWLTEQFAEKQVEPNSSLGQAIAYLLRHWEKLTLFLRQPGAPLDNNICERALKEAQADSYGCSLLFDERRADKIGNCCTSQADAVASVGSASISRRRTMSKSIRRVPPRA